MKKIKLNKLKEGDCVITEMGTLEAVIRALENGFVKTNVLQWDTDVEFEPNFKDVFVLDETNSEGLYLV